jgi:hypothetical protein
MGKLLKNLVIEKGRQWDQILAQEKFTFNNSVNKSTGKSPFEIVYGIQPRGITKLRDLNQYEFKSAGAKDFATKCKNSMIESASSYKTTS